ncbi:hypothetical protein ACRQ5Q_13705 [Bradyrhizobium sp. PMVTL-01]|uniref:hypothetical protein n=1 Tax=Bradyrhizobium sp. PMVTL-01 TaxID=3434999 RepID=UPI003F71AAD2
MSELAGLLRNLGRRMITMRTPLILAAAILGLSASAFAQTAAPKATATPKARAAKPHKQPAAPMGCKLVGTVKGTKLWAGDCVAAAPAAPETPPLASPAEPPSGVNAPAAEKQ